MFNLLCYKVRIIPFTASESPEVRMALPMATRAPDPSALAAYWAEYEDLCRQISSVNDEDDNNYEGKFQ
ncbi:unnamed protein product [Arctia plantaginis]|uniref:Uncharacterized protein n=1 Tax=Arctia plantaginis TaxID=874455 RepID=A0A8S1A2W7_ARCPL|nr:unnamed protein product [Arctia plantaginis]